jgi:hypothetical protein
MIKEEVIFEE